MFEKRRTVRVYEGADKIKGSVTSRWSGVNVAEGAADSYSLRSSRSSAWYKVIICPHLTVQLRWLVPHISIINSSPTLYRLWISNWQRRYVTYTLYQRVSDICFAPNLYQNDSALRHSQQRTPAWLLSLLVGSFIVRSLLIWCTRIKVGGGGEGGGGRRNEATWGKIKFVRRVFLEATINCLCTLAFSRGSLCLNWKFYTRIVPPLFACFKFPHRPTGFIRRNYMPWAYGILCMVCSETQVPKGLRVNFT